MHDPAYIDAVRQAGRDGLGNLAVRAGHPGQPGVRRHARGVSALVAGATLAAARAVWRGEARHGVNIAGGLHHAMRRSASGFCVYNDPAIAISALLDAGRGADRVRGPRRAPRRRRAGGLLPRPPGPDHQPARAPGHLVSRAPGWRRRSASGDGRGYAVNMAAARLHRRRGLAAGVRRGGPAAAARVRGPRCWSASTAATATGSTRWPTSSSASTRSGAPRSWCTTWRTRSAGGRWLLTGGGGYELVQVVPRSWTHLLAVAAGEPVDPGRAVPDRWRALAAARAGEQAPVRR